MSPVGFEEEPVSPRSESGDSAQWCVVSPEVKPKHPRRPESHAAPSGESGNVYADAMYTVHSLCLFQDKARTRALLLRLSVSRTVLVHSRASKHHLLGTALLHTTLSASS